MNRPETISLITQTFTQAENGYESVTESATTVFCNWRDGVGLEEFYTSRKAGLRASATAEVLTWEYSGEQLVEFQGKRYNVIRAYQSRPDYKVLVLEEVIR